jgi:hypothetical protein
MTREKVLLVRECHGCNYDGGTAERFTEAIEAWIEWPDVPPPTRTFVGYSDWRIVSSVLGGDPVRQ